MCFRRGIYRVLKSLNKCTGSRIHILMKNNMEIVSILLWLNVFVSMLLENVIEFEIIPEGRWITKLVQIC